MVSGYNFENFVLGLQHKTNATLVFGVSCEARGSKRISTYPLYTTLRGGVGVRGFLKNLASIFHEG